MTQENNTEQKMRTEERHERKRTLSSSATPNTAPSATAKAMRSVFQGTPIVSEYRAHTFPNPVKHVHDNSGIVTRERMRVTKPMNVLPSSH
jgi:hypothetical protein